MRSTSLYLWSQTADNDEANPSTTYAGTKSLRYDEFSEVFNVLIFHRKSMGAEEFQGRISGLDSAECVSIRLNLR